MAGRNPVTDLDQRYSSPGTPPTPWAEASQRLETAEVYWISTVRPDGRPHVTPMIAIWLDGTIYFCTGGTERKAKNLAQNAHVVVATGCNTLGEGLDLVLEGDAVRVTDDVTLRRLVDRYKSKYGWAFTVRNGAFHGEGGEALVFKVAPETAFGFGKGNAFSQTRWLFDQGE